MKPNSPRLYTKSSVLLSLLLFLFACSPNDAPTNPKLEKIDKIVDSLFSAQDWPALSIGIINAGQIHDLHRGQLLNGQAPKSSTLYEVASLTKTFTGTLLAHAIVDAKAEIDQDIRQHLPDSFPNLAYEGMPITFRHLATHQSGLPRFFPDTPGLFDEPDWDNLPARINALQEGFTKADFFQSLSLVQLDTVPGSNFIYSNAGPNLLGYLLENMYEKTYEDLLQTKILAPLGMTGTQLHITAVDTSQLAFGKNMNGKRMPVRAEKGMMAEGGLFTSTADMIKYMQFHLDTTSAVALAARQELWNGQFGDFEAGLFWQIFKDGNNPDRIFQNGGAYGTSSWVTLIPELQLGVFLVTNYAGEGVHQQLNQMADQILAVLQDQH